MSRRDPRRFQSRRRRLLAATTVLLALTSLTLLLPRSASPLPVLDTLGGDFTLDSTLGRALSLGDLRGRLVLLNFGFTGCPDVCPTALARMRALVLDLAALGIDVQPLFVTIDPERDSIDVLSDYVAHFHPALVGLTGSAADVAEVTERYRVYVEREPAPSAESDYGFAHSTHIYLIDGRGRLRAMFGASHTLERMVAETRTLDPNPLRHLWRLVP
ncbi:MAG: SCO family protein [Pseudomonadales bacterium]